MDLKNELISGGMSILFAAVGLAANNIYDVATNQFTLRRGQAGDLVDEKLRQMLVRGLNNVNSQLRSQSLSLLDASRSFLEEGVTFLDVAFCELNKNQMASEVNAKDEVATGVPGTSAEDQFANAKNCFLSSHKQATIAFFNTGLSTQHRIVACMIRVAARILSLIRCSNSKATTNTCRVALDDLHRLPAIQGMFTVFFGRGPRSMLERAERLEHIISVLFINHAVFKFASKDSCNNPSLITWPKIRLSNNRAFNPILNAHDILAKISREYELVKQLNQSGLVWKIFTSERHYVVKKPGEIIILKEDRITVIYSTGESKDFMFSDDTTQSRLIESKQNSLAVDCNGKLYALRWLETRNENGNVTKNFVLNVFDEHYNMEPEYVLDFLGTEEYKNVDIAVDEKHSLILIKDSDGQVFICNEKGEKRFKFKQAKDWVLMNMSISDNNDIMMVSDNHSTVKTYSLNERTIKLEKVFPQDYKVMQVAFHKKTCKITVFAYTRTQEKDWWLSHHYSENGTHETTVPLTQMKNPEKYCWKKTISNLPSSATVVVIGKNIIFS